MKRKITIVKVLLTISCLEFFGPILKDTGHSHLMNEEWVGHAKVHLAWLLGYLFFSGLANLYFIWFRKPFSLNHLKIVALWQACHFAGFWAAIAFVPNYGGVIADPRYHTYILGMEENIFGFTVLSLILVAAMYLMKFQIKENVTA